jgi:hypothetical protein
MVTMSCLCCSSSFLIATNKYNYFLLLQMCFNAFDKAADLDVLDHPVLNFIYYLVSFGLCRCSLAYNALVDIVKLIDILFIGVFLLLVLNSLTLRFGTRAI